MTVPAYSSSNIGPLAEQMFHPEVVTFGETMALLMPPNSKGLEYTGQLSKSFAGAESNVAIGLARLGHRAGWCGWLGNDPLGRMIVKSLRGEGVDIAGSKLIDEAPTGLILRETLLGKSSVYYYRRYSAASLMHPACLDEDYIAKASILHITGITPALSETCLETVLEAIRIARRHGVKVCFDPNLRLKLWSIEEARKALLPIAAEADYFLPGMDELRLLYDTEDFDDIVQRLSRLSAVCVVKGGPGVTYLLERGELQAAAYFPVERVVDPVGAGDAFCAGFIAGLLRGQPTFEAVRLGNLLGSLVIQTEGDWEGMPTWGDVETALHVRSHIER